MFYEKADIQAHRFTDIILRKLVSVHMQAADFYCTGKVAHIHVCSLKLLTALLLA